MEAQWGQTPSPRSLRREPGLSTGLIPPRTLSLIEGHGEAGTIEMSLLWCQGTKGQGLAVILVSPSLCFCLLAFCVPA